MTENVLPTWHSCIPQPKDCLIMIGLPGGEVQQFVIGASQPFKDQNLKQDRTTNVLLLNLQCVRYQLEFLFGIGKKSAGFSHFRSSATFSVEPNMVLNRFTLIYSNKTVTVWSKKMNPNFPLIFQISWFELTKKRDSFFVIPTPS